MKIPGLRKAVLGMEPYVPGKTIEEVQRDLGLETIVKLGSNENPYGPFPNALEAMRRELANANRYPDIAFEEIKGLISSRMGLGPENIAISHGAEGMLQAMVKCFLEPGDEVLLPSATYGLYREISKLMGATVTAVPMRDFSVDMDSMCEAVSKHTRLVWLCNPNNPTGTLMGRGELEKLLETLPETAWVVLDEAYAEFADPAALPDRARLINEGANLVSVRTFSKAWGLAGVRLGYGAARPEMITAIDTVSEPFNANRVGIAGGIATLTKDLPAAEAAIGKIIGDRHRMEDALTDMGCTVVPSSTNFVFFETPCPCVPLSQELLHRGVIVRSCDIWGYDRAVRVTVGTEKETDFFLETLDRTLRELKGA